MRKSLSGNFFRLPGPVGRSKKVAPTIAAAWILTNSEGEASAVAELHSYQSYIETQTLLVYPTETEAKNPDFLKKLGFLISGIFINTQADIVYFASNRSEFMESVETQQWGLIKTVLVPTTPDISFAKTPFLEQRVLCLWKEKWWETVLGQEYKKKLQYLQIRVEKREKAAYEKSCEARRKKRRFSFLRRLFRPKVDD